MPARPRPAVPRTIPRGAHAAVLMLNLSADTITSMRDDWEKLRGKDYAGCLLQILQFVTGVIAIIVFIR